MPKRIVTPSSLPKILRELDRWEGKLTWDLFCRRVAAVLGVASVSKHTMYAYPTIKRAFQSRQAELREGGTQVDGRDLTLRVAAKRIADLEAQVRRLDETNKALLDQFRRWQYNAYAQGVRMDLLDLDRPLPEVDRSGKGKAKKTRTAKAR